MNDNKQIGVINEVGDMGLGFTPLSKEDQEKVESEVLNDEGKDED